MIIKNNSAKVIGLGKTIIMPGSEVPGFTKEETATPAIQAYVRLGLVEVLEEEKAAASSDSAEPAPADETAGRKKRTAPTRKASDAE